MGQFLIIAAFLIVFGIIAYLGHLQQRRRREEMAALARQIGWQFYPGKDHSYEIRYSQFDEFTRGHSRYAYNTMSGSADIDGRSWTVCGGDYHYKITSGSGKHRSTRTYRFSYLILKLPFRGLPDFRIRSEGIMDKLGAWIGLDDIDFESAEFSDRFHVSSADKRFVYDVVDPRMMQFLLDSSPPTIGIAHGCCCLCDGKSCWSLEEFRSTLDWAARFFDHWPDHVTASLEDARRN